MDVKDSRDPPESLEEMEHRLVIRLLDQERTILNQNKTIAEVTSELNTLKASMDKNTEALSEFVELAKNLKVGMKMLGYVEATAVFVTKVAGGIVIVWAGWKFLVKEAVARMLSS